MILELMCDFACNFIYGLFSALEILKLPLESLNVLFTFLEVGNWVVGSDLMTLIIGSVVGWYAFKLSTGFALWVYRLIPFCG